MRRPPLLLLAGLSPKLRDCVVVFLESGIWPNLRRPRTFTEKILWRKHFDRNPIFPTLADKASVRGFVEKRVGPDVLTRVYGTFDRVEDIDVARLPDRFVVKATHDCGSTRLVPAKAAAQWPRIARHLRQALRRRYGRLTNVWWYADIPRRIVVEELLPGPSGGPPPDFKFYCFDGQVRFITVDLDRFGDHAFAVFTADWRRIDVAYGSFAKSAPPIPKPARFETMVHVAERLSAGLDFVRVDLYEVGSRIVFGELTLAPSAGWGWARPRWFDEWAGSLWTLPGAASPTSDSAPKESPAITLP